MPVHSCNALNSASFSALRTPARGGIAGACSAMNARTSARNSANSGPMPYSIVASGALIDSGTAPAARSRNASARPTNTALAAARRNSR